MNLEGRQFTGRPPIIHAVVPHQRVTLDGAFFDEIGEPFEGQRPDLGIAGGCIPFGLGDGREWIWWRRDGGWNSRRGLGPRTAHRHHVFADPAPDLEYLTPDFLVGDGVPGTAVVAQEFHVRTFAVASDGTISLGSPR